MSHRRILDGQPRYDTRTRTVLYYYDTPYGSWQSSESRLIIGPYGPETVRETSSAYPATANGPPSRVIYRGSARERAEEYIRTGNPDEVITGGAGDLHRHPAAAAYFTTSENYADICARNHGHTGMVIQQRVPSRLLDRSHVFPETPGNDWRSTILTNRAMDRTPRYPSAVGQSRRSDIAMAPTAQVQTEDLLRRTQLHPSGHRYESAFQPVLELSSSDDSDIDEHRREPRYVQQIRFQDTALAELATLPRHARRAHRRR